jgi:8-hydroxy-5-deazaflavin:NADPH oxidoreductase
VENLACEAGFDSLDVGDLTCARYLEQVAHLNIAIAVGKQRGTNAAIIYVNPN